MKISTKGRYALRMLLDLAQNQGDGFVALKDVAERQNVSKKYLEQIVPMLNKAGILAASRGFQGGYRLAQAPDRCTVGDILRVTEGSIAPVACLDRGPRALQPQRGLHHAAGLAGPAPRHRRIPRRHHPAGYPRRQPHRVFGRLPARVRRLKPRGTRFFPRNVLTYAVRYDKITR